MKKLILLSMLFFLSHNIFARGESSSDKEKSITLRATNTLGTDHPMTQGLNFMAREIEKRTNGAVKIDVYPNSQLGGNKEMVEGVALGTIDIANQFAGGFASYVPEMEVLALPFLFKTPEHLLQSLSSGVGQILAEKLEKKGFIPLTYFYGGSRSVINNIRPVNNLADLKGLKLRVIPVNVVIDAFNNMGAIAVPMSQGEVYSALEQSVIDGWENSPVTLYSLKLYEQSKYFSYTRHLMTPDLVALSSKAAGKMGSENLNILKEVAVEASDYELSLWNEMEKKQVAEMTAKGWIIFNEPGDMAPFIAAAKSTWDDYEAKYQNGIVQKVLSTANE